MNCKPCKKQRVRKIGDNDDDMMRRSLSLGKGGDESGEKRIRDGRHSRGTE